MKNKLIIESSRLFSF